MGVFDDSDHELILLETGYRKSVQSLTLSDRPRLVKNLKLYALVRSKAELDQFCEGLRECGVLEAVRQHPAVMEPYFLHMPMELSAGEQCWIAVIVCESVCMPLFLKRGFIQDFQLEGVNIIMVVNPWIKREVRVS